MLNKPTSLKLLGRCDMLGHTGLIVKEVEHKAIYGSPAHHTIEFDMI